MYTFEMYPEHSQVSSIARFYPPDEVIGRETARNKAAILYLIDRAGCRVRLDRQDGRRTAARCSTTSRSGGAGPAIRSAPTPRPLARGSEAIPSSTTKQVGTTTSGSKAFVTGASAGSTSSANDLDGGVTTTTSRRSSCPRPVGKLTFRYYLATAQQLVVRGDWFRAYVEREDGTRTVVAPRSGRPRTRTRPPGRRASVGLDAWAGQTIRIVFEARGREPGRAGRGGGGRHADHAAVGEGRARLSRTRARLAPRPRPRSSAHLAPARLALASPACARPPRARLVRLRSPASRPPGPRPPRHPRRRVMSFFGRPELPHGCDAHPRHHRSRRAGRRAAPMRPDTWRSSARYVVVQDPSTRGAVAAARVSAWPGATTAWTSATRSSSSAGTSSAPWSSAAGVALRWSSASSPGACRCPRASSRASKTGSCAA